MWAIFMRKANQVHRSYVNQIHFEVDAFPWEQHVKKIPDENI